MALPPQHPETASHPDKRSSDRAEFDRKLARALAELAATGMWRSNYDPAPDRWLRRRGLRLRPPHYRDPWRYGLGLGVHFAVTWGVLMWLFVWSAEGMPVPVAIGAASAAGVGFGLFMALHMAWGRRRHRLTRWEEL